MKFTDKEAARCSVCGGRVKPKTITFTHELNGTVCLVDDVPAEVCVQCGERYISPSTVIAIEKTLKREQPDEMRPIPVYHFPAR